ncbi:MAG TPA: serine/threonine-protein kinase [Gammaproteobacteria bacterium]
MYKTRSSNLFKSLTGLALLAGLLIALIIPRFGWVSMLDGYMFSLGSAILPKPEVDNPIRMVRLPEAALNTPDGIRTLRKLLNKIHKSDAAVTALLIDPLPMLDYESSVVDNDDAQGEWSLTRGELTKLAWSLENYGIQVGIATGNGKTGFFGSSAIKPITPADGIQKWLPFIFQTPGYSINLAEDQNAYPFERLPYSNSAQLPLPLIWFDDTGNTMVPDLALRMYQLLHKNSPVNWQGNGVIQLATQNIQTDARAQAYGYFSASAGRNAKITQLEFERALEADNRSFKNKIIIIGQDETSMVNLANAVTNLYANSLYHTPSWLHGLALFLLLVVLVYSLVLLPKVQKYTALLLSVLVLVIGIVAQYGMLLTQSVWMPMIPVYLYLVFGHIVIHFKHISDARLDYLRLQAHEAFKNLGSYQFEQGDHDKAMMNLLKCKPTDDVLEMLYDIGLGFERRRQYDKALHLFSEINVRNADYKDVKKRLQSLTSVSGTQTQVLSPSQSTKTLVLPDMDLQLPVLGRYELEKELGRGAMGVVYLGRDPKINRRVAIKTLDYSQFSEKEIKSIKSRFFREAEAAGRLSHHNIVTVYDVGDEKDFAFIAMDYVPGKSLGDYTHKDNLLDIAEVYRIAAVVAETLEYAHSQNIVHRDIKPSNIMYNPDNGQIKITDFGIARITDSVRTRTGSFMGSPSYMAPEQMTGSNVDGRADIYALGASFYQLLCGELPFDADSLGNLAYKITHEKHKPIRDIRPELPASATRIVNKALQKKASDRYASGKEMAEAIRKAMP